MSQFSGSGAVARIEVGPPCKSERLSRLAAGLAQSSARHRVLGQGLPTSLESQGMGRTVGSQSRGGGDREEELRLARKSPLGFTAGPAPPRTVPSRPAAASWLPPSALWTTDTCQVLLGDSKVEEEDQILCSSNSRNLQSDRGDDKDKSD